MKHTAGKPDEILSVLDPDHDLKFGEPPQPIEVENAGKAIAHRFCTESVDFVVQWADRSTASLGHVVARELGAVLVHAEDDLGKLTVTGVPSVGSRAVIVSLDWTEGRGHEALLTMLKDHGVHISAIASVHSRQPPVSL